MSLADHLVAMWYAPKPTPLARALWPLSLIFGVLVAFRRTLYRVGLVRSHALRVPVIVVGNVTIGGAGKTPTMKVGTRRIDAIAVSRFITSFWSFAIFDWK